MFIGKVKMKAYYDVIVVGAGAAGMTAAISAARMGARTAILEHMDEAGKKLLATGNGKCNFTNQVQGVECYRGQNPAFVLPALAQFGLSETLDFFRAIGIFPKEKRGGYYYPVSEQASSVRQALVLELKRLGVDIHYNIGIRSIKKDDREYFCFETKQGMFFSKSCIIATGGKAAKKTGSDGSGVPYIKSFGHTVLEFVPALVQLKGAQSFLKELSGIRADAHITLFVDDTQTSSDRGEVQLTDFGVSGIPAFQVSRYAVYALKKQKKVHLSLDFAPDLDYNTLLDYFLLQKERDRKTQRELRLTCKAEQKGCPRGNTADIHLQDTLIGFLNKKLIPVMLREAGLAEEILLSRCGKKEFEKLIDTIKHFRIDITGSKDFDSAQVCAGGVSTAQINPGTMESQLVSGLYFAGEVVDIDGMCGGYNLQWAWTSGWVAGKHAGTA